MLARFHLSHHSLDLQYLDSSGQVSADDFVSRTGKQQSTTIIMKKPLEKPLVEKTRLTEQCSSPCISERHEGKGILNFITFSSSEYF